MGQKVNPVGIRLGINKKHTSTWYAGSKLYSKYLLADAKARDFLFSKLKAAGVGRIEIERPAGNAKITIKSARPGVVIGRKGEDIDRLRSDVAAIVGVPVQINIEEIRRPEIG
jgi:small subunit ribosomal protein S3